MVVLFLVALLIPTAFLLAGKLYRYIRHTASLVDIRNDGALIFSKVERDLKTCGKFSVDPGNRGITISGPSGEVHYFQKGDGFFRETRDGIQRMSRHRAVDAAWVKSNGLISAEIVFFIKNINTGKSSRLRILHDFDSPRPGSSNGGGEEIPQ